MKTVRLAYMAISLGIFLWCSIFMPEAMAATCEMTDSPDITCSRESDGVEHWVRQNPQNDPPYFFRKLKELFAVVLPNPNQLPFGKSVAFLVGVSQYETIRPDLPFVKNDLEDMRDFLLGIGGFDEVFIAQEKMVTRDLIERYMTKILKNALAKEDRLLFYYAGHGADQEGLTGYMQFANAAPDEFYGSQVLAIKQAEEWSTILPQRHVLMIFDCCASGLAFTPRGSSVLTVAEVAATLSKNGSRIVITAGTADEETFEVPQGKRGNGVFTRAFLNVIKSGRADLSNASGQDGLITVEEIMAQATTDIAVFCAKNGKRLTPQQWPLDPNEYRGTFLFLNPQVEQQQIRLREEYIDEIGAESVSRSGELVGEVGFFQVTSQMKGEVYLDQQRIDSIENGDVKEYDASPGKHIVELQYRGERYVEHVIVKKGERSFVKFRKQSIKTDIPKSTLVTSAISMSKSKIIPTKTEELPLKPASPCWNNDTPGATCTEEITGMEFVYVPGGCFQMGSPENEKYRGADETPHQVCVHQGSGFWMGKYEVTQAQWEAMLNQNPSHFQGANLPVESVSWNDAQAFLQSLNGNGRSLRFRLPSEAEWEYAARAGMQTAYVFGDDSAQFNDYGWYLGNSEKKTHPAGLKSPNDFGLYDMLGNVWEWTQDTYADYSDTPSDGGAYGRIDDKNAKVMRGGAWNLIPLDSRCAVRASNNPTFKFSTLGFRIVLER